MPSIFKSSWIAVTPSRVPAILKSISPRWSSKPSISLNTAFLVPSVIKPIAMPATCPFKGAPAHINDIEPPQTEAMDEEPFDSIISETILIV